VPKSSIAIRSPASRSSSSTGSTQRGSCIAVDSVISTITAAGSSPAASTCCLTLSAKRGWRNCRSDALKVSAMSRPCSRQPLASAHAASTTQSPIGSISPVYSATGRKSSGGISPRSRSWQRISASAAATRPSSSEKIG
jgi:hypothetical protein